VMKIPTPDIKNPKHVAVIVVGGVGLGLVGRQVSKRRGGVTTESATGDATSDTPAVDLSQYALAENSAGNLGAYGATAPAVDTTTTRDVGTISFPVTKWAITIDGVEYLTDGTNIELAKPIVNVVAPVTPTPATPVPVASAPVPVADRTHVIVSGNTLYGLARQYYGKTDTDTLNKLASVNGLTWNSTRTQVSPFRVGQTLKIPTTL